MKLSTFTLLLVVTVTISMVIAAPSPRHRRDAVNRRMHLKENRKQNAQDQSQRIQYATPPVEIEPQIDVVPYRQSMMESIFILIVYCIIKYFFHFQDRTVPLIAIYHHTVVGACVPVDAAKTFDASQELIHKWKFENNFFA